MNISELCIRRPVMTVLLSSAAVLAGILAYGGIPIATLPSYDTPTVSVTATLPGAPLSTCRRRCCARSVRCLSR